MILVSCDPGLTGAFCLYDTKRGSMDIRPMPTFTKKVGSNKSRTVLDEQGICDLIIGFQLFGATHFVIEEVGGLPRQSAPAAFNFGMGYGCCVATARALGFQLERVRPQVWKTKLRVPADKKAARARASEMLPYKKHLWTKATQDGLAEAAMIAVWAQQHFEGKRR